MDIITTQASLGGDVCRRPGPPVRALRGYFAADTQRCLQTALGLLWVLDGALQFQSFMYSKGFIGMLSKLMNGEPRWLADTMQWGADIASGDLVLWNTLFAVAQVVLGLGILYRPRVRSALAASCLWTLIVWWFGEALGTLFMNTANPLTGAPGAVSLYGLVALVVWPGSRPGGIIGSGGARVAWAALWLVMAYLWLLGANSGADATRNAIDAAPSGVTWLATVQDWAATAAHGHGLAIAVVMALLSVVIGIGVAAMWHARLLLWTAIGVNLVYWVLGQGLGGIFQGGATDPNAGLPFVLLAMAMFGALEPPRSPVPIVRPAVK